MRDEVVDDDPDWAYRSVTVEVTADDDEIEDVLNRVGAGGWRLVATVPLVEDGTTYGVRYVFARPKR